MKVHYNYQYLLRQIKKNTKGEDCLRVLDYGCGKGVLVEAGRSDGIEIYGVELFFSCYGTSLSMRNAARGKVGDDSVGRRIVVVKPNYSAFDIFYIQPNSSPFDVLEEISLADNSGSEYEVEVMIPES